MNVLILTGAGVSAESGIPIYRGPQGLWEGYRLEEVATPEAFARDPVLVHRFYNMRRRQLQESCVMPNAAHRAIAEFEQKHDGEFLLVTQNVDDLHQRAGSINVLPMHGELLKARCQRTGEIFEWRDDMTTESVHPGNANLRGTLRPHIVWFGEMPFGLETIFQAAEQADLFLAIGTSAVVYPAAAIVEHTPRHCRRVEINLEDTPQSGRFETVIRGPASSHVPAFLASLGSNS